MAKREEKVDKPTDKEFKQSKTSSIDFPVIVESLKDDVYHEDGEKFLMGGKRAKQLAAKGYVKIHGEPLITKEEILKAQKKLSAGLVACILFLLSFAPSFGQSSVLMDFKNPLSPYATSDTLTNAAVTYISTLTRVSGDHNTTTIQVVVDELSGTTAGTVILQGSIDGTNFYTLTDSTRVPEVTTWTLTDQAAAQTKAWVLDDSPYLYYRVSHSGGTTMSAIITAKLMAH